jgi:tetratricopeptide (TPR) repeat protein
LSRKSKAKQPIATQAPAHQRYRLEICLALALIAGTLLVFAQVGRFQFVNLDDDLNVYNNAIIANGISPEGIAWAFTAMRPDYWHPLSWLSHMLDVELFRMNAGRHHLTSVAIHILNVLLLFLLLRRMTGAVWRSAAVAALFATHPLRAESVAWVTERKDVLAGFFWWLTTWAYVAYAKRSASWSRYALVIFLFALALMSKPTAMTLPFFLLLLDYWPLGRLRFNARSVAGLLREKLPFFALSGVLVAVTFTAQREMGATELAGHVSVPARMANSLVAYAAYLCNMVWPFRLAAIYPYNAHLPAWQVTAAGLMLAAITAAVLWKAVRFPYLPVGWFWYLGVLLPVIGLVQMGYQSRADRFTYIPMVGIFVLVVWGLSDLMAGWRHRAMAGVALAMVALPALGVCAWRQTGVWRDSVTLFRHNVAVTPENKMALHNLGEALAEQGKTDEAIQCFSNVVRLDPAYSSAYNSRGAALVGKGKLDEAIRDFSESIRLKPRYANAHYNLAVALKALERLDQAQLEYEEALRLGLSRDFTVRARTDLGFLLSHQGKNQAAMSQFWQALSIDPSYLVARRNLGIVLMNMGRYDEAATQFSLLLSVAPNDRQAREFLDLLAGRTNR